MRYFKDDKDVFYIVSNTDVSIPSNWIEIGLEEYQIANPEYVPV